MGGFPGEVPYSMQELCSPASILEKGKNLKSPKVALFPLPKIYHLSLVFVHEWLLSSKLKSHQPLAFRKEA